jgi:hypothetical protein
MSYSQHIVKSIINPELTTDNTLHVVSVVSNPIRFQSRYRLFRDFQTRMRATHNVAFYTVELAFGDRQFEVTESTNPMDLQLHTDQEIWHKESMINLGVKHLLPQSWKYMAWVDGDIEFRSQGWALETIQQLQHYPVVQPWSDCVDLGAYGNILQHFESFASVHRKRIPKQMHPSQPYKYAHSGFAWACTRYFWENVGGLMDFGLLGSSDHHMAFALIGEVKNTIHGGMSESFVSRCMDWQRSACHVTHGDSIGYVKGRLEHHFHGPKKARKYRERWQLLINDKFDPDRDLAYDSQGLIKVVNNSKLLSDCQDYFRGRQEDSIEEW